MNAAEFCRESGREALDFNISRRAVVDLVLLVRWTPEFFVGYVHMHWDDGIDSGRSQLA